MKKELVIFYTPQFKKKFHLLPTNIKELAYQKEDIFRKNLFEPSLRTHKLLGKLKNYWSFSINYQYRIVFRFIDKNKILFVDVGTHEIYR